MRYLTPQRLITLRLGVACFRLLMFRTSYTLKLDLCKVCQTFQTFSHLSLLLFTLFIGPVEVKPVWNNIHNHKYSRGCWLLTFESRWWSWRFSSWSCPGRWFRSDRSKDILKRCSIGFCFNEDIEEEKMKTIEHRWTNMNSNLILVGKDPRLWKSASWAPWEKSRRRWVRFGHL